MLEQWKAPLADLDPWRPETFTAERLARLEKWKDRELAGDQSPPKELSEKQLADARRQIERMLGADESEADAIRQRLARLGPALLPEVYARLKNAAADQDRRRLLILRYRLAACDSLVLRWPGGLERLGDTDPRQRRQAAEELAKLAGDDEKPLLLELFADSDPLVREISLRGLQHIGGKEANAALVKLLGDPEPNVRAAVLKQLEESPDAAMVPAVVKYLKEEKDPDLIVHGIGFLRAAKGTEATKCLMSLLKHESWQVRAEAAAGIGKLNDRSGVRLFRPVDVDWPTAGPTIRRRNSRPTPTSPCSICWTTSDAFVVAKAVEGLSEADMAVGRRAAGQSRRQASRPGGQRADDAGRQEQHAAEGDSALAEVLQAREAASARGGDRRALHRHLRDAERRTARGAGRQGERGAHRRRHRAVPDRWINCGKRRRTRPTTRRSTASRQPRRSSSR